MADRVRPLIAGNWKMNGTAAELPELKRIADGVDGTRSSSPYDALICVPATLIDRAIKTVVGSPLAIGGQDCHGAESGAHTGDVSAAMLADAGATHVIVGHSERRADHGETDIDVMDKTLAAHAQGLTAIVCVGETRQEREDGQAMDVVDTQLAGSLPKDAAPGNTVVAYEPVWAIGTGLTPSLHDIEAMHDHMRQRLRERFGPAGARFRLLYGGSVKPANAGEIFGISSVDGALIGGASLKSDDFLAICATVQAR
ncbi:triose-phosphate isomerase [Oceaniradius stylonematis]|uniref:triose-phosphate isomerase n=1 Tax=Oceaniradius stylonematis TaxID=2184161 RepID=UPI003C7AE5F3